MSAEINQLERNILRTFLEKVCEEQSYDSTVSDSKIIKDTQKYLKAALRNAKDKCTCNRRSYDMCEVCQASDRELITLRSVFRVLRVAKKHNLTPIEIQGVIENALRTVNPTAQK